ncbi:MAG TPA: tetratricopeptide repeat protein, partial [Mariprofundaceae bacterium]|nr:tetratricopeptide repeat protein [Mariprofundaceae bacterium]
YILRARALAISGNTEEAIDLLSILLIHQPRLLEARLLHVSLLANMNRLDEAHRSINTGNRYEETPELRKIEADLLIRQNRLNDAVKVLQAMQKLDMDDETPTLLLSQIAQQQKDRGKAEQILRDYIKQRPGSIRVRNALGRLLVQSDRIQEAINLYKGLVRDTGGTAEALSTLGLLYYQNRDYEHAAEQFRKVLASAPDDNARFYLAASLEAMDKRNEAKKLYQEIDKKSIAYVDAQLRLAGLDLAANHASEAEKRAKAVLADHPDDGDAYMLLSSIYLVQQKFQSLLDETEDALALQHIPSRLLFNRAVAYEHFKQYENVERSLRELLSTNPNHSEALNFLGYVFADQGINLVEARELIQRALEEKPDDGYYLDSLAWVYFKQGNFKQAAKLQRSAIEQISDDPVMFEHLGDILWRSGDKSEAGKSWQKALELKHEKPHMIKKKIEEGLPDL